MVPPFQYNADVMDIDFGFDPEDTSLVKPSDVGLYEHGVASRYQDKGMMLSEQQAKAEDNAMKYLMESMNKQAEVSPEQMLATALLNIIPTAGGYLIGKSVGEPDLPPGYFEAGGTRAALGKGVYGAEAGALMGLEGGSNAAQGYLKALEGDQEQQNKVYGAMASVENQRASRLGQEADQYKQAAINTQSKIDLALDPTLRNAQIEDARRIADVQAEARSRYDNDGTTDFDRMTPPQQQRYLADKAGVDAQGNPVQDSSIRDFTLRPTGRVLEKAAAADSLPVLQQRVRGLYAKAIAEIGPGFIEAYMRQGYAAFPANIQQEFKSTLNAMAMELNRAVDPTPSEGGRAAQLALLEGSIANGNFINLLDNKVYSARQSALNELRPFTFGPNANTAAKLIYEDYKKRWGAGSKRADAMKRIQELEAKGN